MGGGQKVRMPGREVEDNGVSTVGARPSARSSVLHTTWNLFSPQTNNTGMQPDILFKHFLLLLFLPSVAVGWVLTRGFAQLR